MVMRELNIGKGRQVIKYNVYVNSRHSYSSEQSVSMLAILRYNGCRVHGVLCELYRALVIRIANKQKSITHAYLHNESIEQGGAKC